MSLLCKFGLHAYEEIKKTRNTNLPFSSYVIYRCKRCDRTITIFEHTGIQGTFREILDNDSRSEYAGAYQVFGLFLICIGVIVFLAWFLM